jgi:hypothetical protein
MGGDTAVERSRERTLLWGCLAAGAAVLAVVLFVSGSVIAGVIAVLAALVFVLFSTMGSQTADCPQCGERVHGVLPSPGLCKNCGTYVMEQDGKLIETPNDYVGEDSYYFKAPIDRLLKNLNVRWPHMCAICCRTPSRAEELTLNRAPVGFGTGLSWTFRIPYCSQHREGVEADGVHFGFRSHAYWRQFCAANGLTPKDAMTW